MPHSILDLITDRQADVPAAAEHTTTSNSNPDQT
jgi:hypothetical protein